MNSHPGGPPPLTALHGSVLPRPHSDQLALLCHGHAVRLVALGSGGGRLPPVALQTLGHGAGGPVCCGAWDASGALLAVGTAAAVHLYAVNPRGRAEAVGAQPLRFTAKARPPGLPPPGPPWSTLR